METPSPNPPGHELIRAIGRWSLVALVVNSIIGSGVFGLPSTVAALIGNYSPYAVLAAGAGMSVIIGCFAEVASRFQEAGGPYLYARVAFGRLTGIQTAWMLWLGQVAAPAANANLFVIYLGEFFPHAKDPLPRGLILTVLVGFLTLVNIRGRLGPTRASAPALEHRDRTHCVPQHQSVAESRAALGLRLRRIRDRTRAHE